MDDNRDTERHATVNHMNNDTRDEYEHDRSRVIHSAGFRRLQGKTQVLGISEGDFHRTRLTHSMEVAQIGRGIVQDLKSRYRTEVTKVLPPENLIETQCLIHDFGHPPFGHAGERELNECMLEWGGFEGNGQTLRLVARLEPHTPQKGLNLTRRTLLGVLKYPVAYSKALVNSNGDAKKEPPESRHVV